MKLAWIIYDREYGTAEIVFTKPESWRGGDVVQIVYSVIEKDE